jgi:hypothetical protein
MKGAFQNKRKLKIDAGAETAFSMQSMRLLFISRMVGESNSFLAPIRRMGESDSWYHGLVVDGRRRFV